VPIIFGQDAADGPSIGGVGVAEDQVGVGDGEAFVDEAGEPVDLGAADAVARL
jgi:hypothetical protein